MQQLNPTRTQHLFAPLHLELLQLLRGLAPVDWLRPAVGNWSVKDVASHILDGDLRRLAAGRDGHRITPDPDFVAWINRINADWVRAFQRVSPAALVDLLALTGPQVAAYFKSLDPFGEAVFPVSWAGESRSLHWMDIGRDYTEKWHHQQQIRDAVEAPALTQRDWVHPVLEIFIRSLPARYQGTEFNEIAVEIEGEAADLWTLTPHGLFSGSHRPQTRIRLHQDVAWRMFTKGMSADCAREHAKVEGDESLAAPFFGTLAIIGSEARP